MSKFDPITEQEFLDFCNERIPISYVIQASEEMIKAFDDALGRRLEECNKSVKYSKGERWDTIS